MDEKNQHLKVLVIGERGLLWTKGCKPSEQKNNNINTNSNQNTQTSPYSN